MTTQKRHFGEIPATTVAGTFNTGDLSVSCSDLSSWPTNFPYDVVISRASSSLRERITVGGKSGNTLNTLTRAVDGTTAKLHDVGATVEPCLSAVNLDELNQRLKGTANGDIDYYDGSAWQKLAKGTSNQVLKTGTPPAWTSLSSLVDAGYAVTKGGLLVPNGTTWGVHTAPATDQMIMRKLAANADGWENTFLGGVPVFTDTTARDTAIPSPATGQLCYIAGSTSNDGLYSYNGVSWKARIWNMPWGLAAGVAAITANQTGITTVTDVTTLSVTFTAVTNRNYRLLAHVRIIQQAGGGGTQTVTITDSAGTTTYATSSGSNGASEIYTHKAEDVRTFTAGSTTLKVRAASTALADVQASSASRGWFLVEDVGPASGPT